MANKLDLTSNEWCELVFDGKNKEFGAYEMRRTSAARHNKATIIIIIIAILGFSVPALIKFVTPEVTEKEIMTEVTTLSQLPPPEVKNNDVIKKPNAAPPPPLRSSIKFTAPVIKKDEEVKEGDELKSQEELMGAKMSISIADVKGNDEINGEDIANLKEIAQDPGTVTEEPILTFVEQKPQFPGGEKEMIKFLKKNFEYPKLALENQIQGRVTIRFVVGTDGSIGNIEVLGKLDPVCDKEAIRLVKLMPKWIPGKQNGSNVRVYFILPISFTLADQ